MTGIGVATQPAHEGAPPFAQAFEAIVANVAQVVKGKESAVRLALVCLAAEGHLLVEDVPGVGKTSLAKSMAQSLDLDWRRIQFTPDLLPSDVTGASIYDRATSTFTFRPGGIFANVVLGDEINRASPKTQAALLEAMEERQVTVDATTYALPQPFLVIATQNPIEHEGTYRLPESQLDRFMMRLRMGYPDRRAEVAMLDADLGGTYAAALAPVADTATVRAMIRGAAAVHVAPALKGYIVDLATASRNHPGLRVGVSPRATLGVLRTSRALAASAGRDYVVPEDIKALLVPVLEHRLVLSSDAAFSGLRGAEILSDIVRAVPVPSGRVGS
jgi:MoxR-like ATPase